MGAFMSTERKHKRIIKNELKKYHIDQSELLPEKETKVKICKSNNMFSDCQFLGRPQTLNEFKKSNKQITNSVSIYIIDCVEGGINNIESIKEYLNAYYNCDIQVFNQKLPSKNCNEIYDWLKSLSLSLSSRLSVIAITNENIYSSNINQMGTGTGIVSLRGIIEYEHQLKLITKIISLSIGFDNCVLLKCNMNNDNLDNIPFNLCSICMRKLHWLLYYDNCYVSNIC